MGGEKKIETGKKAEQPTLRESSRLTSPRSGEKKEKRDLPKTIRTMYTLQLLNFKSPFSSSRIDATRSTPYGGRYQGAVRDVDVKDLRRMVCFADSLLL